jgi:hypothetical protein
MRVLACLVVLSIAPAAWSAFKCVDEKGATHIGDAPPAACANVTTYEVSRSGAVVRKIESSSQEKLRREEADRKRETDRSGVEARRRDQAIVDSYSSEGEIDLARDRNLEIINARLSAATARMKLLEKREKELASALKQQKGKPADKLATHLEEVRAEKGALAVSVERGEKEVQQVRTQFEADKRRWIELRGSR